MARSAPSNRFSRLDLPALGLPTMVARTPSRIRRPRAKLSCRTATSAMQALDFGADFAPRREADVFVGEIDLDFEMRANRDDLGANLGDARGKCARELSERVRECGIAARGDDIGDGLGLGEIDAAVQKCAAGEFARLGHARARVDGERHDAADDEWTAVALDFGDILAGEAGRPAASRLRARDRCVRRLRDRRRRPGASYAA